MKKMYSLMTVLTMFVGGTAFASSGAEAVYSALDVAEQALSAPRTQLKYEKAVGGLSCIKLDDIRSGTSFSCSLNVASADQGAIYSALKVEETTLPAVRTELKYQKSVGSLSCIKTNHIRQGDSFNCSVSF